MLIMWYDAFCYTELPTSRASTRLISLPCLLMTILTLIQIKHANYVDIIAKLYHECFLL